MDAHLPGTSGSAPSPNPVELPSYFGQYLYDIKQDAINGLVVAKAKDNDMATQFVKNYQIHSNTDLSASRQTQQNVGSLTRRLSCKVRGQAPWQVRGSLRLAAFIVQVGPLHAQF